MSQSATSTRSLNPSRDGDSTTALGSLCQCLTRAMALGSFTVIFHPLGILGANSRNLQFGPANIHSWMRPGRAGWTLWELRLLKASDHVTSPRNAFLSHFTIQRTRLFTGCCSAGVRLQQPDSYEQLLLTLQYHKKGCDFNISRPQNVPEQKQLQQRRGAFFPGQLICTRINRTSISFRQYNLHLCLRGFASKTTVT